MTNTENIFRKHQKSIKFSLLREGSQGDIYSFRTYPCKEDITFFFAAYLMHPISCFAFQKVLTFSEFIQPQIMIIQKNPNENLNAGWK